MKRKRQKKFYLPFKVNTWFERDRANVRVDDIDGKTIFDVWDEEVGELIEDGFLKSRDIKQSALDHAAYLLGYDDYYTMRRINDKAIGEGYKDLYDMERWEGK